MGLPDLQSMFRTSAEQLREQLLAFFQNQLESLGLTREQIASQSRSELETSLETVNDAISRAESFGVFRIQITADAGLIVTQSKDKAHYETGILPLLLESKRLILERLASIRSEEKVEDLAQLLRNLPDGQERVRLTTELESLHNQVSLGRNRSEEIQEQQSKLVEQVQAKSAAEIAALKTNLEANQRTAIFYQTFSGSIFAVLGLAVVLVLPTILSWQWLLTHEKRFALQASGTVIILGLAWTLADGNETRRWFALGSLVIAAILGTIGLI